MTSKPKNIFQDLDFLNNLIVGIGEVSKITGIPARQIRYWEEKGIIESKADVDSKSRCYDYFQIKRIILIKELLDDGYTLTAAAEKVESRIQQLHDVFNTLKTKQ